MGRIARRWDRLAPHAMVAPAVLLLLIFALLPFLYSLALSVTTSTLGRPLQRFVGMQNYGQGLTDPTFQLALANTLIFAFGVTLIETVLGFALALLLLDLQRGGAVLRTAALLPMLTPSVAIAVTWQIIYAPTGGLINHYLHLIGLAPQPLAFLADQHLALPSVGMVDVWEWTPFIFLLSYAALQTLPTEPVEAARVDGAGAWSIFWHLTLPLVAPSLLVIFLIRLIMSFKVFDLIYMLTSGGPAFSTETASFYIYQIGFQQFNTGYASALTTLLLIALTLVVTVFTTARGRLVRALT